MKNQLVISCGIELKRESKYIGNFLYSSVYNKAFDDEASLAC